MSDLALETVRAVVLLGIVGFLWKTGRGRFEFTRKGWNLIIVGFGLLLIGSLFDITDNFEELNQFVVIGDTPTEAFLEKFVGFLGGFVILAIGLVKWIPSVQRLSDEVAERKRAENALLQIHEELREALNKEKELNELQRQFVSMASHEFRTPLAIVDSTAQRLKRRADIMTPDETVKRAEKIRSAVERMTRLMESTLMAARMQEGKIRVEIVPCDIGNLVQEVCSHQQEMAQAHIISCDLIDLPETIQADAGSLEQAFANLLSNAMKFAPDSPDIAVKAWTEGQQVVISVRDHGIGIDEEELHRIGERFFRAKTSTGISGTGIGLNLVKNLVGLHGGSFKIESRRGEGSTFTIYLPIAGPDRSEQPEIKAA